MTDLTRVRIGTIGHVGFDKSALTGVLAGLKGRVLVTDEEDFAPPMDEEKFRRVVEEMRQELRVRDCEPGPVLVGERYRNRAAARVPSPLTHDKRRAAAKRARRDRKRAARGRK